MVSHDDIPSPGRPGRRTRRAIVVIPAHNEENVLGRGLDTLLEGAEEGEFDVVVVANGCTDGTVQVARARHGVRVIDLPSAGKAAALNSADEMLEGFPRLYVDADVELTASAARAVADVLERPGVMVAAPHPAPAPEGISWAVRSHYAVWARLPVTQDDYVGSGVFGLSERGHERVSPFPSIIAEDAYVRRSFRRDERRQVDAEFRLHPPRDVRSLLRRAARSRAGNTQLQNSDVGLMTEESSRGFRGVLPQLRDVRAWPQVAVFVMLTLAIRVVGARKTRSGDLATWDRDESSRRLRGDSE